MPQKQFSVLQIFTISSKLFVVNGNGELKKTLLGWLIKFYDIKRRTQQQYR